MAKITNSHPVQHIHGKMSSMDNVYFYVDASGEQRARRRVEDYQQARSPKQRWNNLAFAYAHQQMILAFADQHTAKQNIDDWKNAHKLGPNGKICSSVRAWKFAMLQQEWKMDNPFETWYAEYTKQIVDNAMSKAQSDGTTAFMLRKQLVELQSQVASIAAKLAAMEKK